MRRQDDDEFDILGLFMLGLLVVLALVLGSLAVFIWWRWL